jgi:hypothetical protein
VWIVVRLGGSGTAVIEDARDAHVLLSTEDPDIAPDSQPIDVAMSARRLEVRFARPGAILVRARSGERFAA